MSLALPDDADDAVLAAEAVARPRHTVTGIVLFPSDRARVAAHKDALKARGIRGVNTSALVRAALAQFDPAKVEGERL